MFSGGRETVYWEQISSRYLKKKQKIDQNIVTESRESKWSVRINFSPIHLCHQKKDSWKYTQQWSNITEKNGDRLMKVHKFSFLILFCCEFIKLSLF